MDPFVEGKKYRINEIQRINLDWRKLLLEVNGITRYNDAVDLLNMIIIFYNAGLIQEKDRKYVIHPQFIRLSLISDEKKRRIINTINTIPYDAETLNTTQLVVFLISHLMSDTIIIVKMKPLLIIDFYMFVDDLDVGNHKANQLIHERIRDDYIGVSHIVKTSLFPDMEILDYSYERGFIYVMAMKKDHDFFTTEDIQTITVAINSRGPLAADTWMEGDTSILRKEELDGTKYTGKESIDMGLEVVFDTK